MGLFIYTSYRFNKSFMYKPLSGIIIVLTSTM